MALRARALVGTGDGVFARAVAALAADVVARMRAVLPTPADRLIAIARELGRHGARGHERARGAKVERKRAALRRRMRESVGDEGAAERAVVVIVVAATVHARAAR